MHIKDLEAKKSLHLVELCLTRAEARELMDNLETLLTTNTERHEHVSAADYQTELTVWISEDQR